MRVILLFLFIIISRIFCIPALAEKKNIENKDFLDNISEDIFPKTNYKGTLYFTFGGLDSKTRSETFHFTYENKVRINTTFTGQDKLLTIIESGNAFESPLDLDLQSKKGNTLKISNLIYETPINENLKFIIGPKMFGYMGLAGKSTNYNERIAILDGSNYTTATGNGPSMGLSYYNKGFNYSSKIAYKKNKLNDVHFLNQIGFAKNNFGGTFTANNNDNFDAYGLAIFYKPIHIPSISASIEIKEPNNTNQIENWVIAFQKKIKKDNYGIAIGTYNEDEKIAYEAWGDFEYTKNLKIIPVIFIRETNFSNETGFAINTKFSY